MTDTLAYADGFGRWHVLARDTPRGLTRAIERMTAEIHPRRDTINTSTTRAYVEANIVSLPLSEWDDSPAFGGAPVPPGAWLHFAEYRID